MGWRQAEPCPTLVLQNRFVYNGTLKDSCNYQNARFGSSIASVRDLNQDSYNDVVVGAPLEDNHRGAIYIFHGFQASLLKTPKQVRPGVLAAGAGASRAGISSVSSSRKGFQSVLALLASSRDFEMGAFVFGMGDFTITPVGTLSLLDFVSPQQ